MSKYHTRCTSPKLPQKCEVKRPVEITKPFCDCHECDDPNCPDISKLLSISNKNKSDFGQSMAKGGVGRKSKCSLHSLVQRSSLLDVINADHCPCQIVSRAVRATNIPMNLGLSKRQDTINTEPSSCCSKNIPSSK